MLTLMAERDTALPLARDHAWIAGSPADARARIPVTNPATGKEIGSVPSLPAADVARAIDAAEQALSAWQARSALDRSRILRRLAALITENVDQLARILTLEQGKPLPEARGEILSSVAFFEWFAEEGRRTYGSVIPANDAKLRLSVIKQPVGIVAAITPWNFPSSMIAKKVAPALAVGCTVVLKPSELTPLSAIALAVLASEAGVPDGAFNVVTGDAAMIGGLLCDDPRVRKLSFTGSTVIGKMLAARCAGTVKRVSLELGGNAPFIVFDDADLAAAIQGAVISKFRNSGQTCVCANRFYVQAGIYDAFAKGLAEAAEALVCGDGLVSPEATQGPLIDARAVAKVARHVEDAVAGGAVSLSRCDSAPSGTFVAPMVLTEVAADALLSREETFGPLAGLIRFESEAEAITLANGGAAGLAAYLYTRDLGRSARVAEALAFGMVGLNTGLVSSEVAPFGGVRESGIGREGSSYGIDEYLDLKLICTELPAV